MAPATPGPTCGRSTSPGRPWSSPSTPSSRGTPSGCSPAGPVSRPARGSAFSPPPPPFAPGSPPRRQPRRTGITAGAGLVFLAADHDRDGSTDLYVLDGGEVEVWQGPAFRERILQAPPPPVVGGGGRFALGD